jgi:glutaminyl-tRNA synthetase
MSNGSATKWARECYASDYFEQLYAWALSFDRSGLAYVDSQAADAIREQRGSLTEPGTDSPFRDRPPAESRDLFEKMRAGEYSKTAPTCFALGSTWPRPTSISAIRCCTGFVISITLGPADAWCIYPSYDFAHGQSDAIEEITHSLCTLEFEDHRPLYDWLIEHLPVPARPQQIEFSRLNLDFTVLSKRRLSRLVDEGHVDGWDDPRMPTLAGVRRRGFTPESIRNFCAEIGVTKSESVIPFGVLERNLRDDLNVRAPRRLAVLDPLKVILTNFSEEDTEWLELPNHPQNPEMGTRRLPISRELWIEAGDFMEEAPRKFFRLKPGGEVRLRGAFIIRCDDVVKNDDGEVTHLHLFLSIPESRSGQPGADRKVKGTIHWLSAEHAIRAEVRLYDRLFSVPHPAADKDIDFVEHLNPESLTVVPDARIEPGVESLPPETHLQFERTGYFVIDRDSRPDAPILNRAVTLRDTWAKLEKQLR